MNSPWKKLSSKVVYKNPWFKVREDKVVRPDGKKGIYGFLEWPGSIGVVAITEKQEIYLVGQWRYTANKFSWEIPAGSYHKKSESPLVAAKRELLEEAGLVAKKWTYIGRQYTGIGVSTDRARFYLAQKLNKTHQNPDPSEFGMKVKKIPIKIILTLIRQNKIFDAYTLGGIFKALIYLKRYEQSN